MVHYIYARAVIRVSEDEAFELALEYYDTMRLSNRELSLIMAAENRAHYLLALKEIYG